MSFAIPCVECVSCVFCSRWLWKRCTHTASDDSNNWMLATPEEFEAVPRVCRLILAVYEEDLRNPKWPPKGGYGMNPDWVVKKATYETTHRQAPPYLIYVDHDKKDIVVAIRGLNLSKNKDYAVLMDNRSEPKFLNGYVHNGLLKSAQWLFKQEADTLKELVKSNPSYTLTFAGHSLGSGVASLLTLIVVNTRQEFGNIPRKKLRCYAIAPARCMSLNLAVRYADIINSVVLQDDFLPRTTTPLEIIFSSIFCLPCFLCVRCMRDTCISDTRRLKDETRLYAPGRLYHIVDRKPWRCGRRPPVVKTAVPVEGRFEHIILSCNATQDHAIIWIEKEAQKALDLMKGGENPMEIPPEQKMERKKSIAKEHNDELKSALERAASLEIPHAVVPSQQSFDDEDVKSGCSTSECKSTELSEISKKKTDWDALIDKLFEKDADGKNVLKMVET